ncbi:hypothetical protein F6X40_10160 [Paraburkholderia sp. UCT31]|uniref:hypothetical protein n=1 Tax=Paraburkholderia sp. UCT31 TaxID=2615209 RepID=UPI0016565F0E|nr:hypothetical protein [Paraburkholderia sp. UCT31]MBC8737171.1 hypothetical protein [Paraburkholderia sp. UCT31]
MISKVKSSHDTAYDSARGLCIGEGTAGPIYLDEEALRRHTLVVGKKSESDYLIPRLVAQQIARGGGFIVLHGFPDREMGDKLAHLMKIGDRGDDFRVVNVDHPQTSHTYNPLQSGAPSSSVTRLLHTRYVTGRANAVQLTDVEKKSLENFVQAVQQEEGELTFSRVADAIPSDSSDALQRVAAQLRLFANGKFGEVLDVARPEVSLDDVLRQNLGLFMVLPLMGRDAAAIALGRMFVSDLFFAIAKRAAQNRETDEPPFLLVVDDINLYLTPEVQLLLEVAQAARVAVVAFESDLQSIHNGDPVTGGILVSQTGTKLFVGA